MDVVGEAYLSDKEYGTAMEVGSENESTSPALLDGEINPLDATEAGQCCRPISSCW